MSAQKPIDVTVERANDGQPAYGIIDPDYARIFTKARCVAWANGYAVMMHGSFTRDLDLLAVPWTDKARDVEHLVQQIANATELKVVNPKPSERPHGRLTWTLVLQGFADPRFVDLSVFPPGCTRLEKPAVPVKAAEARSRVPVVVFERPIKFALWRRMDKYVEHIVEHGRINRADMCRLCEVSVPQASKDLNVLLRSNLSLMYDKSRKAYVWHGWAP